MAQRATPSAATEVLAGLVERVTFHNDENGFCVLRVKARGQRDFIDDLPTVEIDGQLARWSNSPLWRSPRGFRSRTRSK